MSFLSNTGWWIGEAVDSSKRRYNQFNTSRSFNLNFSELPDSYYRDTAKKITDLPQGGYIGFSCSWFKHAYTLHAVKEGNKTPFIYVNRGGRHYDLATGESKNATPTVLVFSVDSEKAENFSKALMSAAMTLTGQRKMMSAFLEKHQREFNGKLSQKLKKKDQKTGNCSIANSNIAWHFQLASDEMRQKNISFADSYKATESKYREMRAKDRVQAFKYLLDDRGCYVSDSAFLYNYFQTIEKFFRKDTIYDHKHLVALVDGLRSKEFSKLIEPLTHDNFTFKVNEYINARIQQLKNDHPNITEEYCKRFAQYTRDGLQSSKNSILMLALKKLPLKDQKQIITKDITLIGFADTQLQLVLLEEDYNKYALYANRELKKHSHKVIQDAISGKNKINHQIQRL
ncbi:hypothetical protein [Legionella parisiensis]|nr:hypothetical protein [Legionella parisiensis]